LKVAFGAFLDTHATVNVDDAQRKFGANAATRLKHLDITNWLPTILRRYNPAFVALQSSPVAFAARSGFKHCTDVVSLIKDRKASGGVFGLAPLRFNISVPAPYVSQVDGLDRNFNTTDTAVRVMPASANEDNGIPNWASHNLASQHQTGMSSVQPQTLTTMVGGLLQTQVDHGLTTHERRRDLLSCLHSLTGNMNLASQVAFVADTYSPDMIEEVHGGLFCLVLYFFCSVLFCIVLFCFVLCRFFCFCSLLICKLPNGCKCSYFDSVKEKFSC
jgi:hypothetical protein